MSRVEKPSLNSASTSSWWLACGSPAARARARTRSQSTPRPSSLISNSSRPASTRADRWTRPIAGLPPAIRSSPVVDRVAHGVHERGPQAGPLARVEAHVVAVDLDLHVLAEALGQAAGLLGDAREPHVDRLEPPGRDRRGHVARRGAGAERLDDPREVGLGDVDRAHVARAEQRVEPARERAPQLAELAPRSPPRRDLRPPACGACSHRRNAPPRRDRSRPGAARPRPGNARRPRPAWPRRRRSARRSPRPAPGRRDHRA